MTSEGISLRSLEPGDWFRTLLTRRVGKMLQKDFRWTWVEWKDGGGPDVPHRDLIVEPWPRED